MRHTRIVVWAIGALILSACSGRSETTQPPGATATSIASATKSTPTVTAKGGKTIKQYSSPPAMSIDPRKEHTATLHTNKGDIVVQLLTKEAPKTVNNFVFLAKDGYYEGVKFHRVIKGFMIQGGDPTGTGAGGPGYRFEDEPVTRDYEPGIMAMANSGPNTNGSQFFIMDGKSNLPKNYTIFGTVTQGMDVVHAIAATPVVVGSGGERSRPTEELVIERVAITEK